MTRLAPCACDGDGGGAHFRVVCVRYGVVAALLQGRGHFLLDRRSRVGDVIGVVEERELGDVKLCDSYVAATLAGTLMGAWILLEAALIQLPVVLLPPGSGKLTAHLSPTVMRSREGQLSNIRERGIRVLAEFRHVEG